MYSNFLKTFLSFSSICLATVLAINFFVDPYGLRKSGGRVNNDRVVKAIQVNRLQPNLVAMGSSGIARGLDPDHPILLEKGVTYNLGILGANIYEIEQYFRHAAAGDDLNTAIVSLDFYAFNGLREVRPGFSEARLGSQTILPQDFFGLFLSLDSLRLIFNPEQRGSYFSKKGTYAQHVDPERRKEVFAIEIEEDFSREEDMYWAYQTSTETLNSFQNIVEIAEAKEIEVETFIPPLHVSLFYAAKLTGHWPDYQQWLRSIVAIEPVWDFSGCNSITAETIRSDMKNFDDPSHYTYKVGDMIIERMFGRVSAEVPEDFGVYVTSENIDEHLEQIQEQCEAWQQQNPEIVRWIETLNLEN
ncbi:MAG: hypothetical protein HC886_11490 [Leptolyngbyaceae cyanobacterium SM1_1_3]|nr:hypothetical protein [Leptolyngbyaceae cyanobacterium SM1_1_3]NJN01320.1 hypothetical protein [Leptolyngbyaceae cyanobacterium RM1_1_2]NJO09920.1 hypothetical protein [Leptolyngbyaceae cyanobacterium SL_1_1]NJO52619.1 hypothetical protein [Leptolyngbyaceae cyanobacterium RM2_2_4]